MNEWLLLRLTEVSAKVERLCSRAPLVTDDGAVWMHFDAEPLIAASELIQSSVLVVFNVLQQFLETAVPVTVVHVTMSVRRQIV